MVSAFASWGAQKQKVSDIDERVGVVEEHVAKIDERSRLVERIDERTQMMQQQHALMSAKLDTVLQEVRRFDKPR